MRELKPIRAPQVLTLRIWQEPIGGGEMEWRGRLEHLLSGQVRHFRTWTGLVDQLSSLLCCLDAEGEQRTTGATLELDIALKESSKRRGREVNKQ